MKLKTKHKRLLSLILAIMFVLEPFFSSVGLAMEGGALNEELVHSEVFNKKDSTTYIVPGQDELGNKTNEVTLESNLDDNRLVVQKIDRNGSRLEGAKFGLYNSAEELVREDITNSQGRIDFGKLEKGLYSLKELEAPKGYVLSKDTYIIEVKEDGSLTWSIYRTKAQGRDLNNSIQVKGYNLENNRENVKLFADLLIEEKVQAGDFFTISLDSKLQNPKVANLYIESGLLLAEAKYDQETKTVKYVFTKIAEYESLLNFQIFIEEMEMNTEEVLATNNNEFITTIGDKVQEPVLLDDLEEVKIEEGLEANFLNISSQITGMDWENHTVEYTVSLNPNKNLINKGTSLEISNNSTSVLLNQLDTSIEIFRQDELTGQLVNITSEFNTNNFTADESILESFALDFDENQLNGSTIKIKVTTRFVEGTLEETTRLALRASLQTVDGLDSVQSIDFRENKLEETPVEQSEVIIPVVNFEDDGQETSPIQGNSTIIVENLDENNKPVVGAKYQISDANTKEALWTKTSDERGIAQFVELDPGEYILEEIFTPEGYDSAGYFVEITVDENKNTTYKAIKTEADQVVELEAEVYEEEIEKEKSQVRQQAKLEKMKQKEEELNHKESGKLENSLLGLVEGLLGRSQVAKSTQTVADPTNPTTDPTGTSTTDSTAQPVAEKTQPAAELTSATSISMFSVSATASSINNIETANLNSNNKVDFIKVDGDNKALAGADFELRQKIGGKYSSLSPKVTATSDEKGYFSFENISPGDYGVFETTPPEGYPTPIAEVAHITVNEDGSISGINNERDEASQRYKVVNVKGTAEFSFTKVDEKGNPLEGVEFVLSGYSSQNGTPARFTATSGTDGKISFTELPLDSNYYLRETKTVQGYSIANNLWIVRIIKATTDDTAEIQQKGYKVELYNTGSLTPAGSYGPHPTINGAWAKMNKDKTKYVNVETGAEQELDAVSGATIKPQDLNDYGSWPDLEVATQPLEITNKKAELLVYKKDKDGNPLDGAEFTLTLTDGTGSSIVKSSINGEVAYTDLADGTYELTETKAPLGYDGTKDKWIVTVSNGEITVKKDGPDSGGGTTPVPTDPIEVNEGQASFNSTNIGMGLASKIIKVDRQAGTFEALVYINNNTTARYYYNAALTIDGSISSSITSIEKIENYGVSPSYSVSTTMPNTFDPKLTNTTYYPKSNSSTPNSTSVTINVAGSTGINSRYITKVTGRYDTSSKDPLNLVTSFAGYEYYKYYNSYYPSHGSTISSFTPSPWSPSDPDSPTEPTTDNSIGIGPDGQPTVTVINTKRDPKGKVKIYKTGSDGKPLENVIFELKGPVIDGDSNPPTERVLTDANGEYLFENLQEGEYFLTEIQTVEGYLKTTQIWKIVVDKDGITKILSSDSEDVTVETTTPTESKDSNTTFPKYKGKLNEKTQISSPSETQKQTYYPSYPNPIVYTSEIDGEYAADFDQTVESLRNPWLSDGSKNYGGYLTYQGNYQTTFNKDWHTMDFAKVAKYAEKTSTAVDDHNYDITLKVTGNTYPEKERDKLGVIILYDNSNSMNELVGSTGKTRTTLAKEATTDFVNTLSRQNPDTEFALVTYGSSVFDGKNHTIKFQGNQYTATTPDNSYLEFTSSPTDITTKLPSITPMQYSGKFIYFGGTFTGGAFLEAQKLVEQAKERTTNEFDRLVIVNVTDGVPTLSPIVESTSKNAEGEIVTTFTQVNDTSGTAPNVKGDGEYYYLNGYKFSYNNPYSYYDYTTNKYNTVDNHGFPTVQLSQNVKNLDTEVFNIGIAVTGDAAVSNTTAKTLMANISSGAGYNYDLTDADKLPDAFNSIINSVYRDTISKGIVTDPMGEKVDLVVNGTFDLNDYTISATRNGVEAPDLLNGVTPKYDPTTRTITLEGLNLGLGEEVVFKYKVALRVDDETVSDNVYYFTNGETTLQPNPTAGKVLWNFPVPSVKKIGEEPPQEVPKLSITNFKKPSVEFFKTTVIGTPLAGAKFQLFKKTKDVNGTATRMPVGGEVTVGTDGRIYFENLDVGNYELVETQAPVGYKKLDDPAVTFEVTDKGEVTNISGKELDTSTGNNNIWNWRLPEMEVELKKLDGELNAISKGNVEFKLTKASNNTSGGDVPSHLQTLSFADLGQLQADGKTLKFNIPAEMDGEYILEETKAPEGYIRSFDKYHIMISQAERTIKLVKVTNALGMEKDYKYKDSDGKEVSVKLSENPITLYSEKDKEQGVKNDTLSLDLGIVNQKAVYPSTGGMGTLAFTIIGVAIMGGALIISRRRKEE